MILTTTGNLEGHNVKKYLGIVTGEAIIGSSTWQDVVAKVRDVIEGRPTEYEKMLRQAKDEAMLAMKTEAESLGADAILGINLDFETIDHMLLVSASGTAVEVV